MISKKGIQWKLGLLLVLLTFTLHIKAQKSPAYFDATDTISLVHSPKVRVYSPHRASMLSAVLPGLGQAYNGAFWKIPLVYAALSGCVYAIDFNGTYYKKYRNAYRDYIIQDPANKSYLNLIPPIPDFAESIKPGGTNAEWFKEALKRKKEYYKRYRNLSYVGVLVVYVLNMIDATVDAHFKTFDVSNDLSFHWEPVISPLGSQFHEVGMRMRVEF